MDEKRVSTVDSHLLEEYQEPRSPLLPLHHAPFRKMRRLLPRTLGRRFLVLCALAILSLFALFNYSTSWSAAAGLHCQSARLNPHKILPPEPLDRKFVKGFWKDLRDLFQSHGPSPKHLDQPRHPNGFPTKDKLDSFFNLTDLQAYATKLNHSEVRERLPSYPQNRFSGRGVVILAGGRYSEFAATSLGMLREVGSKLPVEVWSKDTEEEMPGWCDELLTEGMSCRRLADYIDMKLLRHPYQWKVFTLLFSSFREILFLDADSMPVKSPDYVFDSKIYKEKGVILWPDYWKHSGSPWLPLLLGITDSRSDMLADDKSVESGQIVWNKETHWKSLLLATYYNFYGPDFYYTVFNNGWAGWGDKDTFPMALLATGEPYYFVPHEIVTVFVNHTVLGIGMVQADPTNATHHNPLFLHSNIVKWSMRNLMCVGCDDIQGHKPMYHQEDPSSPVHGVLRDGQRMFAVNQLFEKRIDPEPVIWRAVEHTACRSETWYVDDEVCNRTRTHMQLAFGFEFRPSRLGDDICVIDPSPTNYTAWLENKG